jgi:integrase
MSAKQAARKECSWVLRYRLGGKGKEVTLGNYPAMSLKAAGLEAARLRLAIQQGVDVATAKQAAKVSANGDPADMIVSDLFAEFFQRTITDRWKDADKMRSLFELHIQPKMGSVKVVDVRPAHIDAVLKPLAERGVVATASKALQYLKRLFDYAMTRHLIAANPATPFGWRDIGGKTGPRSRVLSRDELTRLFAAMNDTPNFPPYVRVAVKLLLALGVRKSELVQAKWDEFDISKAIWRIPSERAKTKTPIRIPLPASAVMELEAMRMKSWNDYVFPVHRMSPGKTTGYMGDVTINQALYRLQSDIEPFTVHDLRRTCRTHLATLGVAPHIAELCLNHKQKGLTAVYDVHDYFDERRAALEAWASVLTACEAGDADRVIPIRGKAA